MLESPKTFRSLVVADILELNCVESLESRLLVGRGAGVVLLAPGKVPSAGNEAGGDEDGRRVVDSRGGDGNEGGHAEQGHGKSRPGCQRVSFVPNDENRFECVLTERDDVGGDTELAEVEGAADKVGAAVEETDTNGNGVRGSQANDTNTGEGVEGSAGAEVDDTENDLDNHAEHHGVQGNVQLGVDLLPPAGTRDGTVTSEGPGATRGGGGAADTAKDGQDDERKEESKGTARCSHGVLDDGGDGLTGSQVDQVGDVGEHENERDEEQETGQGVEADGENECLGDLSSGLLDLLAHGDNHASGRSGVSGVKETDAERPSIGPSGVGLEVGEDVFGIVTAVLGNDEDGDDDGEDTSECPEDSGGLSHEKFSILSFHTTIQHRARGSRSILTSRMGSHLLPSEDTMLQIKVKPRKMRKTWYGSPARTPTPGSDSKTLTHATMNRAVPKFTARVMVMFPTTYNQPQIQLATRRYLGEDSMKAW